MDVISLSKATKAKKSIKKLQDRLGMNGTEQGKDVRDIYANVKTRLEELEKKDPHITLYNRVSEVEANTAINLNKHNLHINSILNKNKYGLTDLAFDDFGDDSGIDHSKSTGYEFDSVGRKVKIASGQTQAEVVTTAEETNVVPRMITVSQAFNEILTGIGIVDLITGVHTNTSVTDGKIKLSMKSQELIKTLNETFTTFDATKWRLSGDAIHHSSGYIQLTRAVNSVNGALEYLQEVNTKRFICEFDHYAGEGSGADVVEFRWSGNEFAIQIDEYFNSGYDQTANNLKLLVNSNKVKEVALPFDVDNRTWRRIVVDVNNGHVVVKIDGTVYLDYTIANYNPSSKNIKFYSYTGDLNNRHLIDNVVLYEEKTIYFSTGTYESPVLDLGDNFKNIVKIDQIIDIPSVTTGQTAASVKLYTSTSSDNVTFSDWQPANPDGTIVSPSARYIKVKAELVGGGEVQEKTIYDFTSTETSNFETNDKVVFDGSLKLKTTYTDNMTVDDSFTDTGTLLRKTIDKTQFKAIEKIEVI